MPRLGVAASEWQLMRGRQCPGIGQELSMEIKRGGASDEQEEPGDSIINCYFEKSVSHVG